MREYRCDKCQGRLAMIEATSGDILELFKTTLKMLIWRSQVDIRFACQ